MKKLKRILFYIPKSVLIKIILTLVILFLAENVFAATVDISNNVYSPGVSSCDINSPANYLYYGSSGGGGTGSMGTACIGGTGCNVTNQGYLTMLVASITYNLQPSTTYNITFSNPVRTSSQNGFKNLSTSNVRGFISQYCSSDEAYSLTINSVTLDGGKVIVNFTTPSYFNSYTWFRIVLGNGSSNISAQDTFRLNWVNLEDLSNGSNSNDTQSIINNNNSNTQNIINNDNSNTQSIINNNNQNTQQIIDSNKSCTIYDKDYIIKSDSFIASNGLVGDWIGYGVTDFISIVNSRIRVVNRFNTNLNYFHIAFYDSSKSFISSLSLSQVSDNQILDVPTNSYFVRFTIKISENKPTIEICRNGNQAITDSITNDDAPEWDISGINLSDDSVISDLLLMPINFLNKLYNGVSGTCTPYRLNFGLTGGNETITLSCLHLEQIFGSSLWNVIDSLICLFMCYEIAMMCVTIFNDFTSVRDSFDSLYSPRHAKPLGKHTSEVE